MCGSARAAGAADLAPDLRWKCVEVAEDSVMLLDDVEFRGKAWQNVRTALNKAGKEDIELESANWADCSPVVTDQLRAISGEWFGDKALPEIGFTLGTLREADDPEVRLHLAVGADRTVEGFTSWMPVSDNGEVVGWTLDLMRRRDDRFRPVMEFLIGASARKFHDKGDRFMSLSAAPLAKASDDLSGSSDQRVLQKLLDFLGATLSRTTGSNLCSRSNRSSTLSTTRCIWCFPTRPHFWRSVSPSPAPTCPAPARSTGPEWDGK